ncbi:MAG TPA: pesticin C-terminus-like muramidase [Pyrinomonadaceae bacterium]|nr:pesticin C-terminus-like muramidase [Pyrinomonadaceae bacterium]
MAFSQKAFDLILSFEGMGQPRQWPGGESGVTIGFGYDLGYVTAAQFQEDWGDQLPADVMTKLKTAIGLKGIPAKNKAAQLKDVKIDRAPSLVVFTERTVPQYEAQTRAAFPGFDALPTDAQGALVSLVFNRGASMKGDRRTEMRAIRDAVPSGDLQEIADQLRKMKRLWVGQGLDGLLRRRDAEADMVEACIT